MPVNPPGALELQHYDLVPPVTTFALPAAGTNNTTLGVRTGAGRYVLKRYAVPHGAAGLRWRSGTGVRTEASLDQWHGKRGQAGRAAPRGFPAANRFL